MNFYDDRPEDYDTFHDQMQSRMFRYQLWGNSPQTARRMAIWDSGLPFTFIALPCLVVFGAFIFALCALPEFNVRLLSIIFHFQDKVTLASHALMITGHLWILTVGIILFLSFILYHRR